MCKFKQPSQFHLNDLSENSILKHAICHMSPISMRVPVEATFLLNLNGICPLNLTEKKNVRDTKLPIHSSITVQFFDNQNENKIKPTNVSGDYLPSDFRILILTYEPRHQKNSHRGLRPGKTQTGLLSHRSWLEA